MRSLSLKCSHSGHCRREGGGSQRGPMACEAGAQQSPLCENRTVYLCWMLLVGIWLASVLTTSNQTALTILVIRFAAIWLLVPEVCAAHSFTLKIVDVPECSRRLCPVCSYRFRSSSHSVFLPTSGTVRLSSACWHASPAAFLVAFPHMCLMTVGPSLHGHRALGFLRIYGVSWFCHLYLNWFLEILENDCFSPCSHFVADFLVLFGSFFKNPFFFFNFGNCLGHCFSTHL